MVNGASKQLLACSALSEKQNSRIGRRYTLHLMSRLLHGLVFANDPREPISLCVFLAEQEIFPQKLLLLRRTLHQEIQMLQVHGLLDEVIGAFLHRRDGVFHRAVRRDENDRDGGIGLLGFV